MSIIVPDDPFDPVAPPGAPGEPGPPGVPGRNAQIILPQEYVYGMWNQGGAGVPLSTWDGRVISPNYGYDAYTGLPVFGRMTVEPPTTHQTLIENHGSLETLTLWDDITDPVLGIPRAYPGYRALPGWASQMWLWNFPGGRPNHTVRRHVVPGDMVGDYVIEHEQNLDCQIDDDGNDITYALSPTGFVIPDSPPKIVAPTSFRFRRVGRRVELAGLTAIGEPGTVVGTMPPDFRPGTTQHFPVAGWRAGYLIINDFGAGNRWAFPDVIYDEHGVQVVPIGDQQSLYTASLASYIKAGLLRIEPSGDIIVEVAEIDVDGDNGPLYQSFAFTTDGIAYDVPVGDERRPLPIWTPPGWSLDQLLAEEDSLDSILAHYATLDDLADHQRREET